MRRRIPITAVAFAASLALAVAPYSAASAQPVRTLAPASATLTEEFTHIGSVRELHDGRVLVTDEDENRLLIADLAGNAVRALGRAGKGPGEYAELGRLSATRGDSTLLSDNGSRRWLLLVGDSIVETIASSDPVIEATGASLLGADTLGNVLSSRPMAFLDLGAGRRRIHRLHVLVDRRTARVDTVTTISGAIIETRSSGPANARTNMSFMLVYSVSDQSAMFEDGWVAVARQDPYRVDWRSPTGAVTRGAPIAHARTRIDAAEKQHWLADIQRDDPGATIDLSTVPFADELPPFASSALVALPDGTLAILRHPSSRAPGNIYDVIDRRGVRASVLRLSANARLVGRGASAVYVATKDDDGIERLSRHPWD